MLLNQVKSFLEPYLLVDGNDPESKLDFSSFGTIHGRNLKGALGLESMFSLVGGCECANICVRELFVRIHPISLLALRTKNATGEDDAGLTIELRGVRAVFRGKGKEWESRKGAVETLDTRLGIFQALRTAVHDSLIFEQAQHDTLTSSTVKWYGSRIVGNFRMEITDIMIDMFPEEQKEGLYLCVDSMLFSNSTDDPCSSQGFGHVQGSSVVRKLLTLNNISLKCGEKDFVAVGSMEISLAANLSTEATGLCTAVEIRLGETNTNLTKASLTRLMRIPTDMANGTEVEKKAERELGHTLKSFPAITLEDRTRIHASYVRILQSASPDADAELQVNSKLMSELRSAEENHGGPASKLAHDVSWLQLKELQLGETEVNRLLKAAADAIRSQRALETSQATTATKTKIRGIRGWFGRSSSMDDQDESTESLTVVESLSLFQQDPQRARLVFDSLDLDKSGTIDVIELQRGLENCGVNLGTERILHLMREMESSSVMMDASITFDEFRMFCARVNARHSLKPTATANSSVVSVAAVLFVQQIRVQMDSILEADLYGVTVSVQSSGMPYYRRHDVSVGTKRIALTLDQVMVAPVAASLFSAAPIVQWGTGYDAAMSSSTSSLGRSASDRRKRQIRTKTSIRFVEIRPSILMDYHAAKRSENTEEKDLDTSSTVTDLSRGPAFRIRCQLRDGETNKMQRIYRTAYSKWETPTHAAFPSSKPLEFVRIAEAPVRADEELTFELLKGEPRSDEQEGLLKRLLLAPFRRGGPDDASDDGEDVYLRPGGGDEQFATLNLKLDRPSSAGIEFSKSRNQLKTSEKWVPTFNSTGGHVADVLVRVRSESSFVEKEDEMLNDEKQQRGPGAMHLALIHVPGIRVNDLGCKLEMSPVEITVTKDGLECIQAASIAVMPDTEQQQPTSVQESSPSSSSDKPLASFPTATAATPSAYVAPVDQNPQQMTTIPADLFGFTTYSSENSDDSPTVPTLLRASVRLTFFGSKSHGDRGSFIRMVQHDKKRKRVRKKSCCGESTGETVVSTEEIVCRDDEDRTFLELVFKPCSMMLETNRGCSGEFARMIGLEGGRDHDVPVHYDDNDTEEEETKTVPETRSLGGDSYVTANESDSETTMSVSSRRILSSRGSTVRSKNLLDVDKEFHASLTFEHDQGLEIIGSVVTIKNRARSDRPLLTFKVIDLRAFVNVKLDPSPEADFAFRVREIVLTDDHDESVPQSKKRNILSRFLWENDDAYALGEQFVVEGRYSLSGTSANVILDGLSVMLTPALRLLKEATAFVPDTSSAQQNEEDAPQSPNPVAQKSSLATQEASTETPLDFNSVMVLPTARVQAKVAFNRVELYLLDVPRLSSSMEKIRALILRTTVTGDVDVQSSAQSGPVPLQEKLSFLICSDVVRQDLRLPDRGVNRLVDPFRLEMGFSTQRFQSSTSGSVEQVVEQAVVRATEEGGIPKNAPEFVQEILVALDGGLNSRMDSSDYRVVSRSLNVVSQLLTPEPGPTPPPPPPPSVQSMSSKDPADSAAPTVWMIMSTIYPTLVLSSSTSSEPKKISSNEQRQQIAEQRKRLAESAKQAYAAPKSMPLQKLEVRIEHIMLGVGVLGEFGFATPFLRAHLGQLKVYLESIAGTWFTTGVDGTGTLSLDCQSYNTISHAWEPLVEPWTVNVRMKRLQNQETMVTALAGSRININITESVVFNLTKFSAFTNPTINPPQEDLRLKGPFCPNWVVNETGEAIEVWPVRDVKDASKPLSGTILSIPRDDVTRMHLKDRRTLFEAGDRLVEKFMVSETKAARLRRDRNPPAMDRKSVLKRVFRAIDRDGNGLLSIPELQRALASQNEVIPQDELSYEVEVATGKPVGEGVSEQDFADFFSKDTANAAGGKSESAVSSLGIRVLTKNRDAASEFFLAPPHKNGVYVLPSSVRTKPSAEVFGIVGKMGRLVVSSVLRVETRIKIENRLVGQTLVMGYFAADRQEEFTETKTNEKSATHTSFNSLRSTLTNWVGRGGSDSTGSARTEVLSTVVREPTFVPVFEIPPGISKCVPLKFLRGDEVTDFYFRVKARSPSSAFAVQSVCLVDSEATQKESAENETYFQSPNLISVGSSQQDIPIHSMRTKKKTRIKSKEQLTSVLRVQSRDEDLMETELVDENLIRADRVVFGSDREFICTERIVPTRQFFCHPVLTVQIISARGLLSTDLSGDSDPYVVVTAGEETFRTSTMWKSLDPKWPGGSSTFRIGEKPNYNLPAEIKLDVYDEDRMGRDDTLGRIVVNTQELIDDLLRTAGDGHVAVRTYYINPAKNSASRLTVGWKYESSANISLPSKIHQRVIAFSPTLTVENLLPFTLEVELQNTKWREVYELGSGKSCVPNPFYDSAFIAKTIRTRVRPIFSKTDERGKDKWTEIDDLDKSFVLDSSEGTYLINVDLLREKDGTRRLIFFADFWMANKAGCDVKLSFELTAQSAGVEKTSTLMMPNIQTKPLAENKMCCLCIAKSKSQDKKELTIRAQIRMADSLDDLQLISVHAKRSKDRLVAISKPIDLEDPKIQANEGTLLVQSETPLLLGGGNAAQTAVSLVDNVFGAMCIIIRPLTPSSTLGRSKLRIKNIRANAGERECNARRVDAWCFVLENLVSVESRGDERTPRRWSDWTLRVTVEEREEDDDEPEISPEGAAALEDSNKVRTSSTDESLTGPSHEHVWTLKLDSLVPGIRSSQYEYWGVLDSTVPDVILSAAPKAHSPNTVSTNEHSPLVMEIGALVHSAHPISVWTRPGTGRRLASERFSIGSTSLYGKWFRTRVITIAPMFTAAAEEGLSIGQVLVKPYGVSDAEAVLLGNVAKPLRMCDVVNPQIQFRLASSPRSMWTRPIPLQHEHDFAVQLRDEKGKRVARFLLDINRTGPSKCIVIRDCPEEMTRVLVRNNTQLPVWLRQVHRPPKRTFKQVLMCGGNAPNTAVSGNLHDGESLLFPLDELGPTSTLPLAFDIFEDVANPADEEDEKYIHAPRLMLYTSNRRSGRGGVVCKLRDGYKARSPDGSFSVVVQSRGAHLMIDMDPPGTKDRTSEEMVLRGNTAPKEDEDAIGVPGAAATNFAMDIAGFGVSIYSSTRKSEVLYCLFQRIHFESSVATSAERDPVDGKKSAMLWTTTKLELSIGKFQIDSSLPTAHYPVMLTSDLSVQKNKRKRFFASPLAKATHLNPDEQPGSGLFSRRKPVETPIPPSNVSPEMEKWAPKMCGPEYRRKRAADSFLRIATHAASPVTKPDAIIYKNIEADIKSLDVRVDEVFLGGMLSVLLAQADASAFSNANVTFDDEDNKASGVKKPEPEDMQLVKTCFEEDLPVPPRDSSFVEKAFISAWTVTLTVKLGSSEELIPLAKRYGIPTNLLVVAIRLSRLEALLFDLPNYPERSVGSEKILTKYSALMMSAFWEQLGEVVFNVAKRIFITVGILRGLAETEKVRLPPDPSEVVALYGPGAFPLPTETLIETNAVHRIELWWHRHKAGQNEEPLPPSDSRLAQLFATASRPQSGKNKPAKRKKCGGAGCI